ncbi:class GN sortase [Oleiagrimonas citrea]|nr:class GN sortase [Oleiagrimonas citrea]
MMLRRTRWLVPVLLGIAVLLGGRAGWIHAKAMLAQVLLERAWAGSDHGRHLRRPWPWADMAPIARLRVPRLHQDLIVLDRDSGQALAFGPGWTPSSAAPGASGLSVISAHRDTQFDFLGKLHTGDRILLNSAEGATRYRVMRAEVVDSRHARLPAADSADGLLLVTCYPFDAIVPGGPLRYVVLAQRVDDATQPIARRIASISAR